MAQVNKGYFQRCLAGMIGCTKSSTAHGVNHVANSNHPIIRMFWLAAFSAGTGIFAYHFYTLLERFVSNPVSTVVNYRKVDFEYPDVTFCPFLPFSLRVIEKLNLTKQLKNISDWRSQDLEDLIQQARLPLDNFILDCHFHEKPCDLRKEFRVIEDPRYKHCYTFSPEDRKAMSTVPQQALSVVLFTEDAHIHSIKFDAIGFKIPSEWQSAGLRISVHPAGSLPHPEVRGMDVPSGMSSLIGLTISRTRQIKDCMNGRQIALCDVHNRARQTLFTYTKEDCYAEQIQRVMYERCKCLSDEFELPAVFCQDNSTGEVVESHYTPICRSEPTSKQCEKNWMGIINRNFLKMVIDKCPYLCDDTHWHTTVYSTTWPSYMASKQVSLIFKDAHAKLLAQNRKSYLDEFAKDDHFEHVESINKNLAHIIVYPQILSGNEAEQQQAYPLISLLSEVGGILGLWLGCSVLTFCEPIELLLHTITPCCMRHVGAIQQRTVRFRGAMRGRAVSLHQASMRRMFGTSSAGAGAGGGGGAGARFVNPPTHSVPPLCTATIIEDDVESDAMPLKNSIGLIAGDVVLDLAEMAMQVAASGEPPEDNELEYQVVQQDEPIKLNQTAEAEADQQADEKLHSE